MKRWGYAAVRAPTDLRTWRHDKARLERRWFKEGAVTILNVDPRPKDSSSALEVRRGAINLAVSQRALGRSATTNPETGPHTMGHSQAGPRSLAAFRTSALRIRMLRVTRHPPGQTPEADVAMRRASVTTGAALR